MLTEPVNGRCTFSIFDFKIQMSCVTDIPVDWLKTCKFGLEHGEPVSLVLSDHGNEYIVLLLQGDSAMLIKDVEGERTLQEYKMGLAAFTKHLVANVRKYLDGWINWYPAQILGGPDDGRRELLRELLADTEEVLRSL